MVNFMNKALDVLQLTLMGLFMLSVGTIGLCLFIMVLSMCLEVVTGIRLVETIIKPLFGH